jgi:hypothetical protein
MNCSKGQRTNSEVDFVSIVYLLHKRGGNVVKVGAGCYGKGEDFGGGGLESEGDLEVVFEIQSFFVHLNKRGSYPWQSSKRRLFLAR